MIYSTANLKLCSLFCRHQYERGRGDHQTLWKRQDDLQGDSPQLGRLHQVPWRVSEVQRHPTHRWVKTFTPLVEFCYFWPMMSLCRLLWEEASGRPPEGGAGERPGAGRAFHSEVQLPPEAVWGADVQHLLRPGPVQQAVWLGVLPGQQHGQQRRPLPRTDGASNHSQLRLFWCLRPDYSLAPPIQLRGYFNLEALQWNNMFFPAVCVNNVFWLCFKTTISGSGIRSTDSWKCIQYVRRLIVVIIHSCDFNCTFLSAPEGDLQRQREDVRRGEAGESCRNRRVSEALRLSHSEHQRSRRYSLDRPQVLRGGGPGSPGSLQGKRCVSVKL